MWNMLNTIFLFIGAIGTVGCGSAPAEMTVGKIVSVPAISTPSENTPAQSTPASDTPSPVVATATVNSVQPSLDSPSPSIAQPEVQTPVAQINSNVTPTVIPSPSSSPSVTPQTQSLTYYQVTKTVAPIYQWSIKTYTAKGSCMVYKTKIYCWDDGFQIIQSWVYNNFTYGPFEYTYWGIGFDSNGDLNNCGGGMHACITDFMTSPTIIAGYVQSNIGSPYSTAVNHVLTTGTPKAVSCIEDNNILDCGSFHIDLDQAIIR